MGKISDIVSCFFLAYLLIGLKAPVMQDLFDRSLQYPKEIPPIVVTVII